MAKKMRSYGKVDRISSLPDPVLCHILSFLSIKEAVFTSILSTRWRYLFASVSNYLGDCHIVTSPTSIREILNFVDRLLLFDTRTNIEKLRLELRKDCSRVYSWISVAVLHRGLQQLNLTIFSQCFTSSMRSTHTLLPAAMFTCKTLVVLRLMIKELVLYVPDDVCLPNLKTLDLSYIKFRNDHSVRKLISGCIMLEDSILEPCKWRSINQLNICHPFLKTLGISCLHCSNPQESFISWIVIDAPSLVNLYYCNKIAAGYSLVNLHSLIKANIYLVLSQDQSAKTCERVIAEFLRAVANVKSLGSSSSSMMLLLSKKDPLPVFEKLVEFELLYDYSPRSWKKESIYLVQNSMPNLERLNLPAEQFLSYIPENAPLLSYLKGLEITYLDERDKLENIKCFLKNATVLEKLTINRETLFDDEEKTKIAEELLASPRKSKNCCILVI